MNQKTMAWIALGGRILVGLVFIYSGFHKAVAPPQEFAVVIESYYLLPISYIMPMATVIPWMEIILGTYLLMGFMTRLSAGVLTGMLASFVFALFSAKMRGIPLENCGCFGTSIHVPPLYAMLLDSTLIVLAILSFRHGRGQYSLDNWVEKGS